MFITYELFGQTDINEVIPKMMYLYLFEVMSLRAIEKTLFNTDDYKGWLSKSFLNYYGINTDKDNKGIYHGQNVDDAVVELENSSRPTHRRVATILKDYFM